VSWPFGMLRSHLSRMDWARNRYRYRSLVKKLALLCAVSFPCGLSLQPFGPTIREQNTTETGGGLSTGIFFVGILLPNLAIFRSTALKIGGKMSPHVNVPARFAPAGRGYLGFELTAAGFPDTADAFDASTLGADTLAG
jgi:hypothetical protein